MEVGILSQFKQSKLTGINRATVGIMDEILKLDNSNNYSFIGHSDWMPYKFQSYPIVWSVNDLTPLNYLYESHPFDLIHSYFYPYDLNKNYKCTKIITINDLIPLTHKDSGFYAPYVYPFFNEAIRKCAQNSDCIIAISEFTKSMIHEYYNIPDERVKVVYDAVYPRELYDKVCNENYGGIAVESLVGKRFLLTVSDTHPRKNQKGLVEAFMIYKEKYPDSDIKLAITGPISHFKTISDIIGRYGSRSDDLIYTGYVSDEELIWLYKNCEAMAYPSFCEGFGIPVLEALYCETAVITANNTSLVEVGGDAVEYCDAESIDSIVASIERVLEDDEYRKKLQSKSLNQASKFSYVKAAKETIDIYNLFQK